MERYFGYRGQLWDIITVGILVNYIMKDVFKNREVSGLLIIVETGKGALRLAMLYAGVVRYGGYLG